MDTLEIGRQSDEIKTVRFLILSDTHSAELASDLPDCDVLLHCGDLTEHGSSQSIIEALQDLGKIRAELKLVIAGNHEISLDQAYYLSQGGSPSEVERARNSIAPSPSSEAQAQGVTFLEEGTHTFTLSSGASFKLYASPYTPGYGTSGFQYASNEDRYNPPGTAPLWAKSVGTESSIIPADVDIVMTHGLPKYVLDSAIDGQSAGCEHLRRAIERVRPKLHCFGHLHEGYGAQGLEYVEKSIDVGGTDTIVPLAKEWVGRNQAKRKGFATLPPGSQDNFREGKQTLCINAAMEGEKGVLQNVPWMVYLDFIAR